MKYLEYLLTQWPWVAILVSLILFTGAVVSLVVPVVVPTILTYPWPESTSKSDRNKTVVLAGSFNPPHNGHLAMIHYLSQRYGRVILVVGMNPDKQYLVSPYQRADLIRKMMKDSSVSNVQVEVVKGYIWRTVKPQGAQLFVRGIRSWEKDGRDERNLQILNTWGPLVCGPLWWPLPTIFLEGKPEYNHVSSTLIRDICRGGNVANEDLNKLVPESIVDEVAKLYGSADK